MSLGLVTGAAAAAWSAQPAAPAGPGTTALISGIESQYADDSVRIQDDFYQHVNGKWLTTTQIPADKSAYDSWYQLADDAETQLRGIVEGLQQSADHPDAERPDPDQQKIADLYTSFMDEAALERQGLAPLAAEFARIDALRSKQQIASLIAHFNQIGVPAPYSPNVHQDAKDSTRYVFDLGQDGLGLPDRDYYLLNDKQLQQTRVLYAQHVQKMLRLAGDDQAAQHARQIVELETALASVQWTKVQNRDPVKTYNKVAFAKLSHLAPGYDWQAYLSDSGVAGRTDYLVIDQPSYLTGFSALLASTPLPVWKNYFRWHLLSEFSRYLSKSFVDQRFSFYGTSLRGIPQIKPRWQRGIELLEQSIGEGLGRIYTAKYFPPESKARIDQLVHNLLAAYQADLETLDWMSPETRRKALAKLATFTPKIGYPTVWRDYSELQISKDDLLGNVLRARVFDYQRNLNKLGKPIDRSEWFMTPQTVNAYYNPEMNEIVFPAAVLQPPMFNARADDAVNYGSIGAIIGHEISHGFDDQGSQYDGDGNLLGVPGWFSQADFDKFKAKTHALVEQYGAREPLPGYHVNGELTLGENIADNSGLAIAYKAYRISLGGTPAPVIDGLTGDQRFYMGWAQVWRGLTRDGETIVELKTDPHSPEKYRGSIPLMNQQAFYDAFDVRPGDGMYLAPEKRVSLW
ncbi:MAG TPA: M13-type metalloendopeptidase [Steroidobacteraceae bacterium]|nr:M13-type metalloendopeptidase [Steroidobacteraceae bacterium]